jgi:hypothetical protein
MPADTPLLHSGVQMRIQLGLLPLVLIGAKHTTPIDDCSIQSLN